jgi:hypothetical protein
MAWHVTRRELSVRPFAPVFCGAFSSDFGIAFLDMTS